MPARLRGKSHQILEDPSRRRPHVLQQGDRQSVPPVPACWGLLAALGVARRHAKTLGLAGRAVRYVAPSTGQDRGSCGRVENPGPAASAVGLSLPGNPANRPWPPAAPHHLNSEGRVSPKLFSSSTENAALPLAALEAACVNMFKVCTSTVRHRDPPLKPKRVNKGG